MSIDLLEACRIAFHPVYVSKFDFELCFPEGDEEILQKWWQIREFCFSFSIEGQLALSSEKQNGERIWEYTVVH